MTLRTRPAVVAVVAVVALAAGVGGAALAAKAPVPKPPAQVVWPFIDFQTVPRLGEENVRGSGCGGATEIPDEIPDGVWAGQIDGLFDNGEPTDDVAAADEVAFDLWCIYRGQLAQQVRDNPDQNVIVDNPEYMVVNNNERSRNVELDNNFLVRYAVRLVDGRCIDPGPAGIDETDDDGDPLYYSKQTWLYIEDGEAQWAFVDCKD